MITSTSNPKIKQVVQWQTRARERRRDGVFVVEGAKMYLEAPEEDIRQVYVSEAFSARDGKLQERLEAKLRRTGCETVSGEVFAKMSDTQTPQGILAVIRQPRYELTELLKKPDPLFVVLEDLQDPGNLGTILRTGEAAGITGVIMSDPTVDIFNPKVVRATMGSIYRVPFVYCGDLRQVLRQMHAEGIRTYAAHLQGTAYYDSFSFKGPTAFLIGNEGSGLTEELAGSASSYIKIPMEGSVESLNAAVAAALLVYEAQRQRRMS